MFFRDSRSFVVRASICVAMVAKTRCQHVRRIAVPIVSICIVIQTGHVSSIHGGPLTYGTLGTVSISRKYGSRFLILTKLLGVY